jgi:hypothetical protein
MLCLLPPLRWQRRRMLVGNDAASCVHHVREDRCLFVSPVAVHGLVGSTHKSAYVASKHGVVGFSKVVSGWAGVSSWPACFPHFTVLHPSRVALSVPLRVSVCAPCLSSPWKLLARGSPPTAFVQVLCPGAVRWRTLGGPVPSSLPTSLPFFMLRVGYSAG